MSEEETRLTGNVSTCPGCSIETVHDPPLEGKRAMYCPRCSELFTPEETFLEQAQSDNKAEAVREILGLEEE